MLEDPYASRINLRPALESDYPFLWELHARTFRDYVDQLWGWDDEFQLQRFREKFDPANRSIIQVGGDAVGAVETHAKADFLFLAYIAIDPAHQRNGIGTHVINSVLEEANALGLPVELQFLKVNPVRKLYERLGFPVIEESRTHFRMRFDPAGKE